MRFVQWSPPKIESYPHSLSNILNPAPLRYTSQIVTTNQKRVHIIGICGVATSALAAAFHKQGWAVTGSDKGFFPPVSTALASMNIPFYAGWHPEKIEEHGRPDIIIAGGGGTSPSNPEIVYAKEKAIPVLSFAQALGQHVVKKNSIVTAGTWGKTTTSALLSFILIKAGMNPSYFTGGLSLSHDAGAMTDSDWSVVEGDEYQAAIWDKQAKFNYYSPKHLLLTSVSWDHADLYPTEQEYMAAFEGLVRKIPSDGIIVACADGPAVEKILTAAGKESQTITYGKEIGTQYYYHSVMHTKNGLEFTIDHKGHSYPISSPMLGRFNAENIAGCFAMAHAIGIAPEVIQKAIQEFKGIKRRFEKRYEGSVTVLDCHAPTPEKATSVLESIREVYDKKIIAVYEPNIGGRQRASQAAYDNAFTAATTVVIPRLSKLKVSAEETERALEGDELAAIISKTHTSAAYTDDDAALISTVTQNAQDGDVIVFLGSHGFRGMIEETVKTLETRNT
jgi:UDP-N-acetylmuramate: L-alanyl-gamma-D-glutamyl-meso-diaminopimelate ligase